MTPAHAPDYDWFARHAHTVEKTAARVGTCLRGHGFDIDDVRQEAALKLLRLARSPRVTGLPDPERYLLRTLRRHVMRAARVRRRLPVPVTDQVFALVEDRGLGFAVAFVADVLADAPAGIAGYIRAAVVDQKIGDDLRRSVGGRNDALAGVRRRASDWLAKQLEAAK